MPILCKDYTWTETEEEVHIVVPLKGVPGAKADIYSTDSYVKVNYPPYLFEVDLHKQVDDLASKATVGNGAVEFRLQKLAAEKWGALKAEGTKEELRARREASQKASFGKQEALVQQKTVEARRRKDQAVRSQMAVEKAEREDLEALKDTEKQKASAAMEDVRRRDIERAAAAPQKKRAPAAKTEGISKAGKGPVAEPGPAAVRKTGKITVKFTPRAFATAARESHAEEEEEWLNKQREAKKAVAAAKKAAAEGGIEGDPLWLKDKGIEFFKAGNFQAAINAFTSAITLDPKMPALYSNRAACHMKLSEFYGASNDCSKALMLLTPPVEANAKSRKIAHTRRAAALAALGDLNSAENDLKAALALDPENEALKNDLEQIRVKIIADGAAEAGTPDGEDEGLD